MEFAYDDWTIAEMAKNIGDTKTEKIFRERSKNYKNVWDSSISFMRPKNLQGEFRKKFDPLETHGQGFIEGNAWTYSLLVPHDPKALIELHGGDKKFLPHLDSIFTMDLPEKYYAHNEDITKDGLMGNYIHGNEPGHHIPYLYNWTSKPYKTQERVRIILRDMYGTTPDGLCGNDDAGQMSAWYTFSAMGFYPVAPGNDQYSIGSPSLKSAKMYLENGNVLSIKTKGQSAKNVYVKKITLNGKPHNRRYFTHKELTSGAEIVYYMSRKPNKKFGSEF